MQLSYMLSQNINLKILQRNVDAEILLVTAISKSKCMDKWQIAPVLQFAKCIHLLKHKLPMNIVNITLVEKHFFSIVLICHS
jgi:hypothetical protein